MPSIRYLKIADIPAILEIEHQYVCRFDVLGIGQCEALPPWCWTERDYLTAIRNHERATPALAAVSVDRCTRRETIRGAMVYSLRATGMEILRLAAAPDDGDVRDAFVRFVQPAIRLTYHIRDGDWHNLRYFLNLGWHPRLVPSYFSDEADAWLVKQPVTSAVRD